MIRKVKMVYHYMTLKMCFFVFDCYFAFWIPCQRKKCILKYLKIFSSIIRESFSCDICEDVSSDLSDLMNHIKSRHKNVNSCFLCQLEIKVCKRVFIFFRINLDPLRPYGTFPEAYGTFPEAYETVPEAVKPLTIFGN